MSFGETVTVVRVTGGGVDEWGDATSGVESRTPVSGVAVAPLEQGESATPDGAVLLDGWRLFMPAGADVIASDSVEVRGRVYRVDGVPGSWVNPYSTSHPGGVEVVVRGS